MLKLNSPNPHTRQGEALPAYTGVSFWLTLSEAFLSLKRQFHRTVLTMLGIIIGTTAVVALLNIGHNVQMESFKTFRLMGSDILMVTLTPTHKNKLIKIPLSYNFKAALTAVTGIKQVIPIAYASLDFNSQGHQTQITILGTTPAFTSVTGIQIIKGRDLTVYDKEALFAVTGYEVSQILKLSSGALSPDTRIPLQGYVFNVIGIANAKPADPLLGLSMNNSIIVPIEVMRRINPSASVSRLIIQAENSDLLSSIGEKLTQKLIYLLPDIQPEVQIPEQLLAGMKHQAALFAWLLSSLGGISLLAGGAGVMNVMLMSVSERRKEIGLRMALGARKKDILWLFLAEASFMSLPGAMAGTVAGLVIALIFSLLAGQDFSLYLPAIPLGAGSALLTGLISGFYPALKAARMQPVQALRND